jgi:hypothetical protein
MDLSRTNRNVWLALCCGGYFVTLAAFAIVYYCVYRSNPQNFSFNADILRSQTSSFKTTAEQELLRLRTKHEANKQLAFDLTQRNEVPEINNGELVFSLPSYKFTFFYALGPPDPNNQILAVAIHDGDGNEVSREVVAVSGIPLFPSRIDFYKDFANASISTLEASIAETERRLSTVESSTPEVWSFWDFVYFSAVTQTTVGYGDILPNSTLVRNIVVAQLILGLVIVTFAVNVVFIRHRE